MDKIKKYFKIIGFVLFVYILFRIDIQDLFSTIKNANFFYLFLALIFWFLTIVFKAVRWKILTDFLSAKINFKEIISIFSKGLLLGILTPGKLGEFYRARYLSDHSNVVLGKSFWSVALDRLVSLLFDVTSSFLALLVLASIIKIKPLPIMLSFFLIVCIVYLVFSRDKTKTIVEFFLKILIPQHFISKSSYFIKDFFEEMKKIKKGMILKLLAYDFIVFIIVVIGHFFIAKAIGITIPLWYLLLIIPVISIITIVPVSIQGIGSREVSFIFLLAPLGISSGQSVAFSISVLFCSTIIGLPGIILYFLDKKR